MFKQSFIPATNKKGFAKLTFSSHELIESTYQKLNKSTGEIEEVEYETFRIYFDVMGKFVGTSQTIGLSLGLSIDEGNKFGVTLKNLGFRFPEFPTAIDDDGFEIADDGTEFDDDGFTQAVSDLSSLEADIMTFLDALKDDEAVFIGKVNRNKKGFWEIDHTSLKPFVKSSK